MSWLSQAASNFWVDDRQTDGSVQRVGGLQSRSVLDHSIIRVFTQALSVCRRTDGLVAVI